MQCFGRFWQSCIIREKAICRFPFCDQMIMIRITNVAHNNDRPSHWIGYTTAISFLNISHSKEKQTFLFCSIRYSYNFQFSCSFQFYRHLLHFWPCNDRCDLKFESFSKHTHSLQLSIILLQYFTMTLLPNIKIFFHVLGNIMFVKRYIENKIYIRLENFLDLYAKILVYF